MSGRKPSICFVAPGAYAVLSGRADLHRTGGAEVQQGHVARELARRGYAVSFVTLDHGQPDAIEHDGIRVFKMCAETDGLPVLRFVHPRWTSLWSAMSRADADIYYQRTYGVETGQVAMWCRRHRRRMIAAIANDRDCDRRLEGQANLRERWLYFHGLKRADLVIAQTNEQRRLLAENLGIQATVVRSCTEAPEATGRSSTAEQRLSDKRVLWIARFSPQKRLDRLLELAERCPQLQFDVIGDGGRSNSEISAAKEQSSSLENVTMHGFLPRSEVVRFYNHAALLVCTSDFEGFPNTFLEAWARGVPTASTVDPDAVIASAGLGGVADSLAELQVLVEGLMGSIKRWQDCSERALGFFQLNHTIGAAGDAYERLLHSLIDRETPDPSRDLSMARNRSEPRP